MAYSVIKSHYYRTSYQLKFDEEYLFAYNSSCRTHVRDLFSCYSISKRNPWKDMPATDSTSPAFYALFGAFILLLAFWLLRSALHSSDNKRRARASKDLRVHLIQVAQSSEISERQALWRTLTARENKVARLAAQDKTDMEIAQQLQISVRTVESHLYRAYRKLNIRSRHELKYIVQHLEE